MRALRKCRRFFFVCDEWIPDDCIGTEYTFMVLTIAVACTAEFAPSVCIYHILK